MVQPGNHKATLIEAIYTESSKKGTPAITVKLKVGEDTILWDGWINSAENFERTYARLINAFGFTGDDEMDPDTKAFKASAFPVKECSIEVENETYEAEDGTSKTRARVKWLNPLHGGAARAKLEPQVVKTKLSQLGSKAAYMAAKKLATSPVGTPKVDEEIPF